MYRPLMTQVNVLCNDETLRVLIGENGCASRLWLTHNVLRSRVVEEAVVNAARIPCVDTLRTAERSIAHEGVASAVVMSSVVVRAVMVLLNRKCKVSGYKVLAKRMRPCLPLTNTARSTRSDSG